MEKDLLEIINHYGVLHQLEYYQTEVWELNEAIIDYSYVEVYKGSPAEKYHREHIAEELGDNFVMLYQFKEYYKLDFELIIGSRTSNITPPTHLKNFFRDVHRLSRKIIEIETYRNMVGIITNEEIFILKGCLKDILYYLQQFQAYYGITDEEIENIMKEKIERTKKRMEENYYD